MTTESTFKELQDALVRLCKKTGRYERVGSHEPTSAPGKGLTASIFMRREVPINTSGLNSTSTLVIWNIQSRLPITYEPKDDIDLKLGGASRDLCRRLAGNFELGVSGVRSIDIRGINGQPLTWEAGYLFQDNIWYRVFDTLVPVILNDAWPEDESDE